MFSKLKKGVKDLKSSVDAHQQAAPAAGPSKSVPSLGSKLDFSAPPLRDSFVTMRNGSLFLADKPFRFSSLNAPELLDGDVGGVFEAQDTFETIAQLGRPVTRTYTLRLKSTNIGRGHINGWSSEWGDWMWDEDRLREMDAMLHEAHERGVKLIIPILNQDFGSESTNWVGSIVDMMRYRKGYANNDDARRNVASFWTDEEMINSVKLIIDKLANRHNTVNGITYRDEPAIMAWETGNELNFQGQPAPAAWTAIISKHLKSRCPNHLVMDGSFARHPSTNACFLEETLKCPDVDLFSYHYYGDGEIERLSKDAARVNKYGKAFVAGEFGFFSSGAKYERFLKIATKSNVAGCLVWSLRPHSAQGGFKTHTEDDTNRSYHAPGWSHVHHHEWDTREAEIVPIIRSHSFAINGESEAPLAPPRPPAQLWKDDGRQCVCWQGSAWADRYVVRIKDAASGAVKNEIQVYDCTKEGEHGVPLQHLAAHGAQPGSTVLTMVALTRDGLASGESQPLLL